MVERRTEKSLFYCVTKKILLVVMIIEINDSTKQNRVVIYLTIQTLRTYSIDDVMR
jgi:hypothetical protein